MKYWLAVISVFLACFSSFAAISLSNSSQNSLVLKHDARGRLVGIYNMAGDLRNAFSCVLYTDVGKLVRFEFDDEEDATKITRIVVELRNGNRTQMILDDESFYSVLSEADRFNLPSILSKGKRVRVTSFGCGAAGRGDRTLESIRALN